MVTRSNDKVTTDESVILWSLSCEGATSLLQSNG